MVESIGTDLSQYRYTYKYDECEVLGYSVIYLDDKNDYYIISDVECSDQCLPFDLLFGHITEEEKEIEHEEKYEDEEEEKTIIHEEENEEHYKEEEKTNNIKKEKEVERKKEKENNKCNKLEKCEICNEESMNLNLCIKCNILKGYYFLNIDSISKEEMSNKYIECVNEHTKPSKFYFDDDNEDYRLCYDTCATCNSSGNWEINNCLTCEINYMKRPDVSGTTNCVLKCPSYYYYTESKQYKCTETEYCPSNYILLIKEKGKCINNCKNDNIYKYQYDNQCLKECPKNTIQDNINFICKDKNIDIPVLTETHHTFFDKNITDDEIEQLVKNYKDNFYYTNNHVSSYKSKNLSLVIYKNTESIFDLPLGIPKLKFEDCINKIKNEYNIKEDLIIVLETEKVGQENDKIIFYSFFNPNNGKKIIYNKLCKNDLVIVEEDLKNKIGNLNEFMYLSICECTLNNLINNNILGENIFFQSAMREIKTLFQETNIEVLRCYKDLFHIEFYLSNHGSFIIFILILIQIVLTIIYFKKYIFSMRKYLFNLTKTFLHYLKKKKKPSSSTKEDNIFRPVQNKFDKFKSNPNKKPIKILSKIDSINKESSKKLMANIKPVSKKISHNEFINNKVQINNKSSRKNLLLVSQKNNINSPLESSLKENKKNSLFFRNNGENYKTFNNSSDLFIIGNILNINMKEYIKTNPNDMDYDNAIRRDQRTFCIYLVENIKTDLLMFNIFCNHEKLNPWPIKLLLFILNIELYFFVNGLFFTEVYLKKIFYDKNNNFLDFMIRFFDRNYYITLIGIIINYIMNYFFLKKEQLKKHSKEKKIVYLFYNMKCNK